MLRCEHDGHDGADDDDDDDGDDADDDGDDDDDDDGDDYDDGADGAADDDGGGDDAKQMNGTLSCGEKNIFLLAVPPVSIMTIISPLELRMKHAKSNTVL